APRHSWLDSAECRAAASDNISGPARPPSLKKSLPTRATTTGVAVLADVLTRQALSAEHSVAMDSKRIVPSRTENRSSNPLLSGAPLAKVTRWWRSRITRSFSASEEVGD